MPPYATNRRRGIHVIHGNNHIGHDMSATSVEPMLKNRHLYLIDERFVRFQDHAIIHEHPGEHQQEPLGQELVHTTTWYSSQELAKFLQQANKEAIKLQRRFCPLPRGLELRTTQGFHSCLKNRLCAMAIVLEIQYAAQNQKRWCSSEMIAKAYSDVTRHCLLQAMEVGLRDQLEALETIRREQEQDKQCYSPACLNMPQWLSTMFNKKAFQQQEQHMFL